MGYTLDRLTTATILSNTVSFELESRGHTRDPLLPVFATAIAPCNHPP